MFLQYLIVRCLKTLAFLFCLGSDGFLRCRRGRGVAHIDALAGVHRDLRRWDRKRLRDVDDAHAVVVDRQPLLPDPVHLLRLVDLNAVDELVYHPLGQLLRPGVLPDRGDEHVRRDLLGGGLIDGVARGPDLLGQRLRHSAP